MPKTPSDKLFLLIRQLSAAEKRYFRLNTQARSGDQPKYLVLFELLDKMDAPDDAFAKQQIYGKQTDGKKYPELKSYLYDLLLKQLIAFDEKRSTSQRIRHLLNGVEALYQRGLYNDCKEVLQKAGKASRKYEDFSALLKVLNWEKKLAYTQMDVDFLHHRLEQIHSEEQQTIEKLSNAAFYRRAFYLLYRQVKEEAQRKPGPVSTDFSADPHFASPDNARSHTARVFYYRTLNLYQYANKDYERFLESGQQLLALLKSRPEFLKMDQSHYIATLSNLVLASGLLGKYEKVREYLEALKAVKPLTEDDRQKIHRQYFTNKFVLCIYTGAFEEAYAEMLRCKETAERLDQKNYETASFYFQYTCICFGCEKYEEALDYLNYWQSQPRSVEREDLQSLARILNLMLHYELGNALLLESLLRSATRYLQKKNRFFPFEKRFFKLIHSLMDAGSPTVRQQLFSELHQEMQDWKKDPSVSTLLQTFDLEAWVEAHMQQRPFAEVVRAKRKN